MKTHFRVSAAASLAVAGMALSVGLSSSVCAAVVPSAWAPRGVGGGGALFSPSFNPHNTSELYISCDMGELFHSSNTAQAWEVVPFGSVVGNRSSNVEFTSDAAVRYTIDHTGEAPRVVRTTDSGASWSPLPVDPTVGGGGGEAYWMSADPDSTQRILISDYLTLYYSSNGGTSFGQKFTFANGGNGFYVAGAFWDATTIYVGSSAGVVVSTDNGSTFATAGFPQIAGHEIVSFCGAKQGGNTRLFAIATPPGDLYPGLFIEDLFGLGAGSLKVYTLDLSAGSPAWTQIQTGIDGSHRPVFVKCARGNTSTAYVAGGINGLDWPVVYKTTNSGASWASIFNTTSNGNIATGWSGQGGDRGWGYGGGAVGFTVAASDPNRIAYTDYGFVHLSTDGGANWKQGYVDPADQNPAGSNTPTGKSYHSVGLENTTCWNVTFLSATHAWASFSDIRGIRSTDGGDTWSFNYSGHTENSSYDCVKHPSNGNAYICTSPIHDIYKTTHLTDSSLNGGGRVLSSSNNGQTWSVVHDFANPVVDLELDPNNATRMYAAVIDPSVGGIYVTNNLNLGASSTWSLLSAPARTEGRPYAIKVLSDGTLVATYCGRRTTQFTDSSGVFVSTNGGTSWTDRSHTNMHYYTKDIVIDPHDATQNTWYVGVWSGYGTPFNPALHQAGGLYRTTDRGVSWTRISDLYRVTSCAVSPVDAEDLYLTTELEGLWHTTNLSNATPTFTAVANYPFTQPERVVYNPFDANEIWVTSFGNGIRVGTLPAGSSVCEWRSLD